MVELLAGITGLRKCRAAHAVIAQTINATAVTGDKGVLLAKLPVEPSGRKPEALRGGNVVDGGGLVAGRIQRDSVDDGEVVDGTMLEREGEIASGFTHRTRELE